MERRYSILMEVFMKHLRAFIAGIVLPSVLIPVFLYAALYLGKPQLLSVPALHLIPIVWGLWNILYFAVGEKVLPVESNVRLLLAGGILGLLVAFVGVFYLHLPALLGLSKFYYFPLVAAPIVYALLWRYVVQPLNTLLGL